MTNPETQKYEVTFVVRDASGKIVHKWTATWNARSFGHVEDQARQLLLVNKDADSKIERIELW